MRNNDETLGECGPRLCINFEGRELAANVACKPGKQGHDTEAHIAHLEDGNTGQSARLTKKIREAFRQNYIEAVLGGGEQE